MKLTVESTALLPLLRTDITIAQLTAAGIDIAALMNDTPAPVVKHNRTDPKPAKVQIKPRAEKYSEEEVDAAMTAIIGTIEYEHGGGLRFEQIVSKVGMHKSRAPLLKRALTRLESDKRVKREGEKRATTYFLV